MKKKTRLNFTYELLFIILPPENFITSGDRDTTMLWQALIGRLGHVVCEGKGDHSNSQSLPVLFLLQFMIFIFLYL